jgi:hypothetical protein
LSEAFEIEATLDRVAAWSDFRLPFEPKGEARVFRDRLRAAIHGLKRTPVLQAAYSSADCSTCDAENVLLYNVGGSPFTGLGSESLLVERHRVPAPTAPSRASRPHFVEYRSLAAATTWRAWRVKRTLIAWSGAAVRGSLSAASAWASVKAGDADLRGRWDGIAPLGVDVHISTDRPIALVSSVKTVLDGVVAAAHSHDGSDAAELAALVAVKLGRTARDALTWLTDHDRAALGPRRLLFARAGGVQWNPADDCLVGIRLSRSRTAPGVTAISAELHELAPFATAL